MRTRAAVALSIAGILVTGSAALAVNTQTLSNSNSGTTGDANKVLLPDSATVTPATVPPDGGAGAGSVPAPAPAQPATGTGSVPVPAPPRDDKGGLRTPPEPGDDSGGHGGSRGRASDD